MWMSMYISVKYHVYVYVNSNISKSKLKKCIIIIHYLPSKKRQIDTTNNIRLSMKYLRTANVCRAGSRMMCSAKLDFLSMFRKTRFGNNVWEDACRIGSLIGGINMLYDLAVAIHVGVLELYVNRLRNTVNDQEITTLRTLPTRLVG